MKKKRKFEERKWMEERGFEYIGTANDFKIPEWWDCVWRRVPCEKDECKICGKIKQDRLRHIIKGEDPDGMKNVFEDVGNSLKETLVMVKKHAEELGIDITNLKDVGDMEEPPEPQKFSLYRDLAKWHKTVGDVLHDAERGGSYWLLTEVAVDLGWYKNTLLVKTYRQFGNRWHLDRGDKYGEVDYQYTKYVLGECLKILKKSLS